MWCCWWDCYCSSALEPLSHKKILVLPMEAPQANNALPNGWKHIKALENCNHKFFFLQLKLTFQFWKFIFTFKKLIWSKTWYLNSKLLFSNLKISISIQKTLLSLNIDILILNIFIWIKKLIFEFWIFKFKF